METAFNFKTTPKKIRYNEDALRKYVSEREYLNVESESATIHWSVIVSAEKDNVFIQFKIDKVVFECEYMEYDETRDDPSGINDPQPYSPFYCDARVETGKDGWRLANTDIPKFEYESENGFHDVFKPVSIEIDFEDKFIVIEEWLSAEDKTDNILHTVEPKVTYGKHRSDDISC